MKTIQDFQKIVAQKHGLGNSLVIGHKPSYFNEATEMYVAYLLGGDKEEVVEEVPIQVGQLNKLWGLNGYTVAQVGHPVYEYKDRYQITLNSEKYPDYTVTFYKETLKPAITFL